LVNTKPRQSHWEIYKIYCHAGQHVKWNADYTVRTEPDRGDTGTPRMLCTCCPV